MAIAFACTCGTEFEVPDELAGLHAPCPNCHTLLVVPAADDDEVVEDVEVEEGPGIYRFADPTAPYREDDEAPARAPAPAEVAPRIDDEPEVVGDAEPADEVEEDIDENASPEFFVAAYPPGSTLRHPKTFRLYACGSELLVLHAGPFGWGLIATLLDRPGVREEIKAAHKNDTGLGGGVLGSDTDAIVRKQLAQRAAVLDRMTLGELRAEAQSDKLSFRVTADNTPKAKIEPPPRDDFAETRTSHLVAGRLKFTHATAGKWDLVLLSLADVRMAMRAFRKVLGHDNVEVTLKLKDDRDNRGS